VASRTSSSSILPAAELADLRRPSEQVASHSNNHLVVGDCSTSSQRVCTA
jgi:hypothetical protein